MFSPEIIKQFLENWPEFKKTEWLKFLAGDVLNQSTFPKENNFDFIIHSAADSVTASSSLDRFDQILIGTRNILEWSALNKKNKPRFLYISSGAVYGSMLSSMDSFAETYQGAPDVTEAPSAYGKAASSGAACSLFLVSGKVDPIIARCLLVGRDLPLNAHFKLSEILYMMPYITRK